MTRRQADLLLIAATAVWGASFPVVKYALAFATPLAFVTLRFALSVLVLTPVTRLRPLPRGGELAGGLLLGGILAVAFATVAIGLVTTTPSRSAFIVATSSILAPLVAVGFTAERPRWWTLAALGVAAVGLYLLTAPQAGGLNPGDVWTFATALVLGAQIVAVRELSLRYEARRLVWVQNVVTGGTVGLAALLLEDLRVTWTLGLLLSLGYTAVFATAITFLWQMRAQREMSSARAALLFCFEPVFAAVASWLWLGERLTLPQWLGGGLILAGMIVADLPAVRLRQAEVASTSSRQ